GCRALEDALDVAGGAADLVKKIRPVGDQSAGSDIVPFVIDRGQLGPGRQRAEQIAMKHRQRTPRHDQPAIRGTREGRHSTLNLARVALVDRAYLYTDARPP